MAFIELNTTNRLEELFTISKTRPIILFKHSVTCPISHDIFNEVSQVEAEINLVVVQSARPISNLIAEKTGIRHESPQAIVLFDKKIIFHASHYDITADDLQKAFEANGE